MERYSRKEVEEILARAAHEERHEMEHDELLAAAAEAGLDPAAVEAAAQAVVVERDLVEARERRKARRRRKFFDHLRAFLVVNSALVLFDFLPDAAIGWAFFPLIGWGIGLAFDAMSRLGPEDPDAAEKKDQKELQRLRRLRGQGRSMDFRLGPHLQVRVDLPDEHPAEREERRGAAVRRTPTPKR